MLVLRLWQAIPRKIWLDPGGKQLVQWPIEEVEQLRRKSVGVTNKVVKPRNHFEVKGLETYQVISTPQGMIYI